MVTLKPVPAFGAGILASVQKLVMVKWSKVCVGDVEGLVLEWCLFLYLERQECSSSCGNFDFYLVTWVPCGRYIECIVSPLLTDRSVGEFIVARALLM